MIGAGGRTDRARPRPAPTSRVIGVLGVLALACVAGLYLLLADRTQQPLAMLVVPVVVVALLETWRPTAVVAGLAVATAVVLGAASDDLDGAGLAARVVVVATTSAAAVAGAAVRERRESALAGVEGRVRDALATTRALNGGGIGTWHWDLATGRVTWDDGLHRLFGLPPGTFEGTFDAWLSRLHPDDRTRVLAEVMAGVDARTVFRFDHRCVWSDGSVHWLEGAGEVLADDEGMVLGATGVAQSIDDRVALLDVERRSRERLEFLARANRALTGSLDLDEVMGAVTAAAIPELADWCSLVVTADRPAAQPRISVAHADPEQVRWALGLQARYPYDPHGQGIPEVVRTGVTQFVPVIDDALLDEAVPDEELRDIVRHLDLASSIIVPLRGAIGPIGALQLVRTHAHPAYTPADVALAEDLAGTIGPALANALLYGRETAARSALEILQQLTATLADTTSVAAVVATASEAGTRALGAHRGLLYVRREDGWLELAGSSGYGPGETDEWRLLSPVSDAAVPEAVRTRGVVELPTRDAIAARYPSLLGPASAEGAVVAVPLLFGRRVLGGLFYAWHGTSHHVTPTEHQLLIQIGNRCASALERARLYEHQRAVATALQRSLLPARLEAPAWLEVAATYAAGQADMEVGGDFYDLVRIDDEHCVLMVGDVCGKGVDAAALTAVARHTARAVLPTARSLGDVLAAVHRALHDFDGRSYTTLCLVALARTASGADVSLVRAGHPAPLLRRCAGGVEALGRPGTILGLVEPRWQVTTHRLGPGDALVLYTDGVTDAPGALAFGEDELATLVATVADPAPAVVIEQLSGALAQRRPRGTRDDLAVLVARLHA